MPSSECDIQIGQIRIFFIDGIGDMTGTITRFDDEACYLMNEGFEWEVPWDASGMTGVGLLVDGEEHKKYMADVEREAVSGGNSQ